MMNYEEKGVSWFQWTVSIIVLVMLTLLGIFVFSRPNKAEMKADDDRAWCEGNGGRMMGGGSFSNPTCVFAPE